MGETWREKAQILNEFVLKIAALLFMTLDHIGLFLLSYLGSSNPTALVFRSIGRLAFPLFAFMLAEGMRKTRSKGKYLLRLTLMWGLVLTAQLILNYACKVKEIADSTNAFADLLLGGLFLYCLSLPGAKKALSALPLSAVLASYGLQLSRANGALSTASFPFFVLPGYSLFGFCLIVGFYFAKNFVDFVSVKYLDGSGQSLEVFQESKGYQSLINFTCATVLFVVTIIGWGLSYIPSISLDVVTMQAVNPGTVGQTWCLLSCILILLYNGRRGPDGKPFRIFTYVYYPMHIAIIFSIFFLIFGY